MRAYLMLLVICLIGGCASSRSTTPVDTTKAERIVGIVQTSVTSLRDVEHGIAADTTVSASNRAKAAKLEKDANTTLPYLTLAKDGLAAVRGDPAAQSKVLTELVAKLGQGDPTIAAAAAILPPLIQELTAEAQAKTSP